MSVESVSSDRPELPDSKEEGDEAIISMSVAGEVTDTSIVEVGRSRPQFQYSREELMIIKSLPLSKRRPDCLDTAYNTSRGVWDPERWLVDRKRSETPPEEERTGKSDQSTENHGKRRSGDPRERIRKEQDGIVLSPQRRSFNSGCFVNVNQPQPRRPESPIGKAEVSHREPARRIGSGRILTRDIWDFRPENEKLESERTEFNFRPGSNTTGPLRDRENREAGRDRGEALRDRERDNLRDREDRYERRSFGRDFGDRAIERSDRNHQSERDKDRWRDRKSSNNDRRRTYSDNRDCDEPEWFSSGPTSQHDTIELRGFEDIPEEKACSSSSKSKKQSPAQKKRGKKSSTEKDEKQNENNTAGPKGRSTPTTMDQPIHVVAAPHSPISEQNEQQSPIPKEKSHLDHNVTESNSETIESSSTACKNQDNSHPDFNLDDFLKSDTFPGVPGLLTNGVGSSDAGSSRFSQWFKRDSPVQQADSRRTSIQDELLNNLLNDITEPNIQIPSVTESNAYFAPISPANTTNHNASAPTTGVKLLEMLQRGNKTNENGQGDAASTVVPLMKNSSIKDMEVSGKVVHSLEELEARMRGGVHPQPPTEHQSVKKNAEDLSAFKKLLAQVTGGQAVPAANGPVHQKQQQPITLMQLLNTQLKSQQQVPQQQQPQVPEALHAPFNQVGSLGPAQHPHQPQMQHENLMKVLQIQQQQQKQQHQQQQQQQQQQQSDMLSMMMGGQRMLGVSPIPPDMQMIMNNGPTSRELLQRPEAQAIIQGLQQGEITRQHLMQQLQNPALQHRHREVLVNILKMYGGTTPRTVSPHTAAPTPQEHILQQMLYQQQQQQRNPSPMNNAYCPAPIIPSNLANNPSALAVQHPVLPHRVPSSREIVIHAQTIMQGALIKKKLEEQRENFRKRQEQQQQQQQPSQAGPGPRNSSPVHSPAKQTLSPTPLAFTPTSVLRKMTAEKEPDGNSEASKLAAQSQVSQMQQMQSAVQILTQGVLARHNPLRPQPAQPSWPNPNVKQHPGRPIVKGGANSGNQYQYSANMDFQQQQQQQQQQQHQRPPTAPTAGVYGNPARSKHTMPSSSMQHPSISQFNVVQNSTMSQRSNPINSQMKPQVQHLPNLQHPQQQISPQQQQQQRTVNTPGQLVLNQNYNPASADGRVMRPQQLNVAVGRQPSPGLGFIGSNGRDLSPTSNQLARWFSPELLAQARAGKLPELGQTNVLSLEELERLQHASTIVHN